MTDVIQDLANRMLRSRGIGPTNYWGGGLAIVGAGCSASAGIPTAMGIVDLALKQLAKMRHQGTNFEGHEARHIYDYLKADGIQFTRPYGSDLYYEIFDRHLDHPNEQRALIKTAIDQGKEYINWAHLRLGQLVAMHCIHTVITTNFDRLVQDGLRRNNVIAAIADGLEAINQVELRPAYPQVVHLHGSVYNYSPRNSTQDIEEIGRAPPMNATLYGLIKEAPFVLVVGYRGEEDGLMLPFREALKALPGRRVFWVLHGKLEDAPEHVKNLPQTRCSIEFLLNQDADIFFENLAIKASMPSFPWMKNPIAPLLKDLADIVPPESSVVKEVLRNYRKTLDVLTDELLSYQRSVLTDNAEDNGCLTDRRSMELDLRRALAQNELLLHFQPIINLATGRIIAVEAFVRWKHPERGLLGPKDFIQIAEDAGLIGRIGEWVIVEACRAAARWPKDVNIAVNFSPFQFRDIVLVETVLGILDEAGIAPSRFEIEITETTMIETNSQAIDALWKLNRLGLKIVLDDFGTGYSSLSYLRRFPFYKLKIDRAFIRNLGPDENAGSIVTAIINLAENMDMTVTAEGVENGLQAQILSQSGCAQAQGHFYYQPMEAAAVANAIADNHGRYRSDDSS